MALHIVLSRLKARWEGGLVFLSERERDFLAAALDSIGHGAMANEAFRVKAKRGERRTLKEAAKSDNIRFAMSWIAKKITTEENEYFTRPRSPAARRWRPQQEFQIRGRVAAFLLVQPPRIALEFIRPPDHVASVRTTKRSLR